MAIRKKFLKKNCWKLAVKIKKIVAIDLSKGMLAAARKLQSKKEIKNVSFEEKGAFKTNYKDGQFEVIYSRRGPTPFTEAFRLLKPEGYFVEIDIGEQDCRAIKEVFGKGQNFGKWNISQLDIFLQGVPIFEDFDSEKDRRLLII